MTPQRSRSWLIGAVLALLALLALGGQITGAVAMPDMAEDAMAWGALCISDAPAPPGHPAPVHHHKQDCAVCPFCAAMAVHAIILPPVASVPARSVAAVQAAAPLPPARAPPRRQYRPNHPRGPPASA